jgi:putative heme iron utilization protein
VRLRQCVPPGGTRAKKFFFMALEALRLHTGAYARTARLTNRVRALVTGRFFKHKMTEYDRIKAEIEELRVECDQLSVNSYQDAKPDNR